MLFNDSTTWDGLSISDIIDKYCIAQFAGTDIVAKIVPYCSQNERKILVEQEQVLAKYLFIKPSCVDEWKKAAPHDTIILKTNKIKEVLTQEEFIERFALLLI